MFIFSLNSSGFGTAPMPRSNVPFSRSEMFFQGHGSMSLFALLQAAAEYPASCKRQGLGGKERVISEISDTVPLNAALFNCIAFFFSFAFVPG